MTLAPNALRLLLLCGTGAFVAMSQATVVPYVALRSGALDAPPVVTGAIVSVGFLIPVVVAVRIGKIVDRFGVRALLLAGAALLVAGPVPAVLAPSLATLALLTVLVNLGHVVCVVASQRAVARTVASRETAFGWFTTCVSFGQLIGPIAAGRAIDAVGFGAGAASIVAMGVAALAFAVATRGRLPRERAAPAAAGASIRRELRANPALATTIAGSGTVLFAMGVHQTFYPVLLDGLGVSAAAIGAILGVRALAAVVVRPFLARATRLSGSRAAVYAASLVCCAVGVALPLGVAPIALAILGSLLIGVGSGLAQPMSMVVLADGTDRSSHGALLGGRMAVNYVGFGLASAAVGSLIAVAGYVAAFLASAALPLLAAGLVVRRSDAIDAPRERNEAEPPPVPGPATR